MISMVSQLNFSSLPQSVAIDISSQFLFLVGIFNAVCQNIAKCGKNGVFHDLLFYSILLNPTPYLKYKKIPHICSRSIQFQALWCRQFGHLKGMKFTPSQNPTLSRRTFTWVIESPDNWWLGEISDVFNQLILNHYTELLNY